MFMDDLYRVEEPRLVASFKNVAAQIMSHIVRRSNGDARKLAEGFAARIADAPWPAKLPAEGEPTVAAYRPALRHIRKVFIDVMEATAMDEQFRPEPGIPWSVELPTIVNPFMVKVREYFHTQGESSPLPRRPGEKRKHHTFGIS